MASRALEPFDPGRGFTVRQSSLVLLGERFNRGDELVTKGVPIRALRRLYEQRRICYSDDIPPLKKSMMEKPVRPPKPEIVHVGDPEEDKAVAVDVMVKENTKKVLLNRANNAGIDVDKLASNVTKAVLADLIYEAESDGAT